MKNKYPLTTLLVRQLNQNPVSKTKLKVMETPLYKLYGFKKPGQMAQFILNQPHINKKQK